MAVLGPSKLIAINTVLRAINELPFAALDSTGTYPSATYGNSIAARAEELFDVVDYEVQARGWDDNTFKCRPFTPSGSPLKITLASDTLHIASAGPNMHRRFSLRNDVVYDMDLETDEFATNDPIYLDVVRKIGFAACSPRLKALITAEAIVVFQQTWRGSMEQDAFLKGRKVPADLAAVRPAIRENPPINPVPVMVPQPVQNSRQ